MSSNKQTVAKRASNVKRKWGYIGDNERWLQFCEKLRERGGSTRWLWEARSNPDLNYPNVHCVGFFGNGFQPGVLVAIVVDYNVYQGDQKGFGLFTDDSAPMADDVDRIAGPNAPAAAAK